ncbi:protein disulfide-isomerase A4 [Rhynchocyon petersi]
MCNDNYITDRMCNDNYITDRMCNDNYITDRMCNDNYITDRMCNDNYITDRSATTTTLRTGVQRQLRYGRECNDNYVTDGSATTTTLRTGCATTTTLRTGVQRQLRYGQDVQRQLRYGREWNDNYVTDGSGTATTLRTGVERQLRYGRECNGNYVTDGSATATTLRTGVQRQLRYGRECNGNYVTDGSATPIGRGHLTFGPQKRKCRPRLAQVASAGRASVDPGREAGDPGDSNWETAIMRPGTAHLFVLLLAQAQLLAVVCTQELGAGEHGSGHLGEAGTVERGSRQLHGESADSSSVEDAIEDEDVEDEDDDLEIKEENGVLVLNDDNFDTFVADKDVVLLEFFAPWCGHCKQFAPEYEKIAETLKSDDPPIPVVKIDATAASALASRFDVSGYPTIKILRKGQAVDYDGARSQEEIIAKVREVAQPTWTPPPEATLVLTKENFDSIVDEADIILVEFYAPWCGHCKKLAPEYEKAAKELSQRSPPIPLAKVDATAETDLAQRFSVSGYPTLKIFRRGKPFDYNGPREKYGIVDYMLEQAGPPSKALMGLKQVQEFLKDGDDVIIIGIFRGEDDPAYQQYQEAANSLREDYRFHHTFSAEVAKFLKVNLGKLVVMQPERFQSRFEPKSHVMDVQGFTEASAIRDHVTQHALPLVGHRRAATEAKRYSRRPLVVVYFSVDFSFDYRAATQFWRSKVLEVAKDFPEYTFAIADEDDYASEVKDLGLGESGEDVNAAVLDEGGRRFAMEPTEFDADALREFVMAFKKGKLKPVIKSQPVPKNNKGPVKVVVGKTFEDIVLDPSKDVLIEFYAPWCGHCKQLEPVYTSLGKKYRGHKGLVIAKMDATANEATSDRYKVEGFPTIYFAPRGDKQNPIRFEGADRDLEHLSRFIEEHATRGHAPDEL